MQLFIHAIALQIWFKSSLIACIQFLKLPVLIFKMLAPVLDIGILIQYLL